MQENLTEKEAQEAWDEYEAEMQKMANENYENLREYVKNCTFNRHRLVKTINYRNFKMEEMKDKEEVSDFKVKAYEKLMDEAVVVIDKLKSEKQQYIQIAGFSAGLCAVVIISYAQNKAAQKYQPFKPYSQKSRQKRAIKR